MQQRAILAQTMADRTQKSAECVLTTANQPHDLTPIALRRQKSAPNAALPQKTEFKVRKSG